MSPTTRRRAIEGGARALAACLLLACGEEGGVSPDGSAPDARVVDASDPPPGDAAPEDAPASDAATGEDGAAPDAPIGPPRCELTVSGPLVVDTAGALIENVRVDADGEPAIRVRAPGVTLRNVYVTHRGAAGIDVSGADDVTLSNVAVDYLGAPPSGPNPSDGHVNILVYRSARFTVEGARLTRGSSGIYLQESPGSVLRRVHGEDFRGPFPRGQIVQWNASHDGLLEDFSNVNPPGSSWPEDNVNVFRSRDVVIRRGLIVGNNSPSGVGVIFDGGDATGRVEDVDAVRMGNGCFSAYDGGEGSVFLRTRCRENVCTGQDGRDPPLSNALMWAGNPARSALRIEDSAWFAACNPGNIVWPRDSFAVVELREEEFTPRPAVDLRFCWE